MRSVVLVLALVGMSMALPRPYPKLGGGFMGIPPRIVGGAVVARNELPYQLSLRYNGQHICGASVLNTNYAITAAHCAVIGSASSFSLVGGDHSISGNDGTEQTRQVSQVKVHSGYNDNTLVNDIALMKLSSPFTLNNYVKAVTIPASSFAASGNAVVSGWGTTSEGGASSDLLRKVTVPIITDAQCRNYYGSSDIVDSMICAGTSGKDSCQGDSGGPLAVSSGGQTVLAGIVSWGIGCARPNYPGVYTEVAKFNSWISSNAT